MALDTAASKPACGHGRQSRPFTGGAVLFLLAGFACEDEPTLPPRPEPASITVSPAEVVFRVLHDTTRLTAVVLDEDGDVIEDYDVVWSAGDTSVATVSGSGLVRATGAGETVVTATADSVSATAAVTVILDRDREALVALYEATGGPDWVSSEGWLSDAPFSDWHGVTTDENGRVVEIDLGDNGLKGTIPPEIEHLTELRKLWLWVNQLRAPIPPEFGNLSKLERLGLSGNEFSGPLPPEFGNLAQLKSLSVGGNDFSGSIPPELAKLKRLEVLRLPRNDFSGSIPPELGDMENAIVVDLGGNALTGEIPPELGDLSRLTYLLLGGNDLTGPIPAELTVPYNVDILDLIGNPLTGPLPDEVGDMARLRQLHLTNTDLSGPLPLSMTRMNRLGEILAGGTDLCAPVDDDFLEWLERLGKRRIASCRKPREGSDAYLTQAVQSRAYPVPLVAGEEALLRVFVVAPAAAGDTIPLVRATFYVNGSETEVIDIEPGSSVVVEALDESSLKYSANTLVPDSLIQPGLEVVVEIDPDETTDPDLGISGRIPETGRMAVDVRTMPELELTLIPFLWKEDPDSTILDITEDLSAGDNLLWQVNALLPVAEIDLKIHDPVVTDSNNAFALLRQTNAIYRAESGSGYYMGMMSGEVTGARGVAYLPGWTSFSVPDSTVVSHELGHNMYMYHAPCGDPPNTDPSFPEPDGTTGAWGYDFRTEALVDPGTLDLMSYCDPTWISDFHFTNALRYRPGRENDALMAGRPAPARSLLIVGGVDRHGVPHLEPVFVIDAAPSLPRGGGDHRLVGATAEGAELFALDFPMPEVADGDGSSSFAFVLPVRPGWADLLDRIILSGPDGSFTLDTGTDRPAAIVRDPRTGQVRAILGDLPPEVRTPADAARLASRPGLEVLFSRGIPDAAAWRR